MKGFFIGVGVLAVLALVVLGGGALYALSLSNKEVRLRNEASAQQEVNEAIYDNVWKVIAQQANVKDDYKGDFKETWKAILEGQGSASRMGSINAFVTKFNPNFDAGIYKRLMTTIEGSRKEFLVSQKKLRDIKREHDNIRTTFPGSLVCGSRPELEVVLVTSGKSKEAFESGREDDISLRPGGGDKKKN